MRLFIVRHGETEANAARILQGHAQNPLSEHGRAQARALAARLKHEQIHACFASDLARARETADIIAREAGLSVIECREIRERSYGEFEGRPAADYEAALSASGLSRELFRPERGENSGDLEKRVGFFLRWVTAQHAENNVLVVSHSGTNKMLLQLLLRQNAHKFEQDNACVSILQLEADRSVHVEVINSVTHLEVCGLRHLSRYE